MGKLIDDKLEQGRDQTFANLIDMLEGHIGVEESKELGKLTDSQILERWSRQLDSAVPVMPKRQPMPVRWKKVIWLVAILAMLLSFASVALHIQILNVVEIICEDFTQFHLDNNFSADFDSLMERWPGAYVPSDLHNFTFRSAGENLVAGELVLVYSNSEGKNFTFYQSGEDTIYRIDTEAAVIEPSQVGTTDGLLIRKDNLATLTWSDGQHLFAIEYRPLEISDTIIHRIAESVAPYQT